MNPVDLQLVTSYLGRVPQGDCWVELRRANESPVVIRNHPILHSGRPMPTLYWLVDPFLVKVVGRLESTGAIGRVQEEITLAEISPIHDAYEQKRNAYLESAQGAEPEHVPSGGVGGTRRGVKCLHAHYANFLVGNTDAVGAWVDVELRKTGDHFDATLPGKIQASEAV